MPISSLPLLPHPFQLSFLFSAFAFLYVLCNCFHFLSLPGMLDHDRTSCAHLSQDTLSSPALVLCFDCCFGSLLGLLALVFSFGALLGFSLSDWSFWSLRSSLSLVNAFSAIFLVSRSLWSLWSRWSLWSLVSSCPACGLRLASAGCAKRKQSAASCRRQVPGVWNSVRLQAYSPLWLRHWPEPLSRSSWF